MITLAKLKKSASTASEIAIIDLMSRLHAKEREKTLGDMRELIHEVSAHTAREVEKLLVESLEAPPADRRMGSAHLEAHFRTTFDFLVGNIDHVIENALNLQTLNSQ